MKNRGFTIIELMVVILVIGILALIAIPNLSGALTRSHDSSAQSASYDAKVSEEMFYQNTGLSGASSYATTLAQLTVWDRNLNKDPGVTFLFRTTNFASGYTFTTHHAAGSSTGYYIVSN